MKKYLLALLIGFTGCATSLAAPSPPAPCNEVVLNHVLATNAPVVGGQVEMLGQTDFYVLYYVPESHNYAVYIMINDPEFAPAMAKQVKAQTLGTCVENKLQYTVLYFLEPAGTKDQEKL